MRKLLLAEDIEATNSPIENKIDFYLIANNVDQAHKYNGFTYESYKNVMLSIYSIERTMHILIDGTSCIEKGTSVKMPKEINLNPFEIKSELNLTQSEELKSVFLKLNTAAENYKQNASSFVDVEEETKDLYQRTKCYLIDLVREVEDLFCQEYGDRVRPLLNQSFLVEDDLFKENHSYLYILEKTPPKGCKSINFVEDPTGEIEAQIRAVEIDLPPESCIYSEPTLCNVTAINGSTNMKFICATSEINEGIGPISYSYSIVISDNSISLILMGILSFVFLQMMLQQGIKSIRKHLRVSIVLLLICSAFVIPVLKVTGLIK